MRVFLVAAIAAGLTVPAVAQPLPKEHYERQERLKKKQKDEADRAYQSSVNKMPDKPYDPWRNVRGSEQGKEKKQ
jgi:hypothetical protein